MGRKSKKIDKVLVDRVYQVSYDILNNIVSPICGIGGIAADLYLADLDCYAHDEETKDKILKKISEEYEVDHEQLQSLSDAPIALIALFCIEVPEYGEFDL